MRVNRQSQALKQNVPRFTSQLNAFASKQHSLRANYKPKTLSKTLSTTLSHDSASSKTHFHYIATRTSLITIPTNTYSLSNRTLHSFTSSKTSLYPLTSKTSSTSRNHSFWKKFSGKSKKGKKNDEDEDELLTPEEEHDEEGIPIKPSDIKLTKREKAIIDAETKKQLTPTLDTLLEEVEEEEEDDEEDGWPDLDEKEVPHTILPPSEEKVVPPPEWTNEVEMNQWYQENADVPPLLDLDPEGDGVEYDNATKATDFRALYDGKRAFFHQKKTEEWLEHIRSMLKEFEAFIYQDLKGEFVNCR